MINKRYILLLICLNGALNIQAKEFDLWNMNFNYGAEVRNRFAYFNNYDMDYDYDNSTIASDIRGQFHMEISGSSPFYLRTLLELGNIDLDKDLEMRDFIQFELKEWYLGFKNKRLKLKLGGLDLNTPGAYVYEDDELGFQVKYDFSFMEAKFFYSPSKFNEYLEDSSEDSLTMNNLIFLGLQQDKFVEIDLWSMYYRGHSEYFTYNSIWTGLELEKIINRFSAELGYTYNFGNVVSPELPLSAQFTHMKLEYAPISRMKIFTRFNLTSGTDGNLETINQFQTVEGEGNLETGLGLLFGGSPFNDQAYFDNESLSIESDNLSDGNISLYDPGLMIYEIGMGYDFEKIASLDLESEIVLGAAHTGDLFDGYGYFNSLIGWEVDIHNKIEFFKNLEYDFSLSYLLPGNSFNAVYELNNDETLGTDTSFKFDCALKYSF